MSKLVRAVLGAVLLVLGVIGAAACQPPSTITVTSTVDAPDLVPGDGVCDAGADGCTLRAAVQEGNASARPVRIALAAGQTYELSLPETAPASDAGGTLKITRDIDLDGHGATITDPDIIISTVDREALIEVNGGSLALHDATVDFRTADENDGYGIINNARLDLNRVTLLGHWRGIAYSGGVTQVAGTLSIRSSTFRLDGSLPPAGAAIRMLGGNAVVSDTTITYTSSWTTSDTPVILQSGGTLLIIDSTVSGNDYSHLIPCPRCPPPGYLWHFQAPAIRHTGGALMIRRSTIIANTQGIVDTGTGGSIDIAGTVLDNIEADCTGAVTSVGYNVDSDGTCFDGSVATDHPPVSLAWPSLADNGGPTLTQMPPAGSLLVDAIPDGTSDLCPSIMPTDQRGQPRPSGGACDIGAVERQPSDL